MEFTDASDRRRLLNDSLLSKAHVALKCNVLKRGEITLDPSDAHPSLEASSLGFRKRCSDDELLLVRETKRKCEHIEDDQA